VTELDQLACPVVRRGAGFDADQARRQLGEERKQLRPSNLPWLAQVPPPATCTDD
jgi:hypothetical protein